MLRKTLIALSLAAVAVFGLGSPAMAAHVGPSGYFSAWNGCPVGYCDASWAIPVQAAGTCHSVPTGANDKWTAVDNNTTHNIDLFQNGSCGGTKWTIYAGTYTGQMGSGANNAVSSYRWH